MQSKALAVLSALLVALALAACGDGGDETSPSASGGETPQQPASPEEIERRAAQIEAERREGEDRGAGQPARAKGDGGSGRSPVAKPPAQHNDSGGGSAQFGNQGGDDSIQEFGQEGGASELQRAAVVLHGYLDARAAQRWEEACSYLSAEVLATLEQFASAYGGDKQLEGCPSILEVFNARSSEAALRESAQADVGSLRMQGDRGFLLYHGPQGVDFAMPVVLEGGEWRLAAPDATPLL